MCLHLKKPLSCTLRHGLARPASSSVLCRPDLPPTLSQREDKGVLRAHQTLLFKQLYSPCRSPPPQQLPPRRRSNFRFIKQSVSSMFLPENPRPLECRRPFRSHRRFSSITRLSSKFSQLYSARPSQQACSLIRGPSCDSQT